MKTIITESELINRARGLREYLNVIEAKFDPNVKALQDKLIQAGATIKADGFMGPATQAAMKQFPNVTTQTDAQQAVGANINSANTTPTTTTYDDGSTMSTGANGAVSSTDTSGAAYKAGSNPALTAPAAAPTAAPTAAPAKAADGGAPPTPEQLKWLGGANPNDPIILAHMRKAVPDAPAAAPADIDIGFGPGKFQPDAAPAPAAPVATESVSYRDDQALARIVHLSRK